MSDTWPDDADEPSIARAELGDRIRRRLARNPMISPIKNDRVEMFLRHGFLSPQECAMLIDRINATSKPSMLFSGSANADYRTSSSSDLDFDDPLALAITRRIDLLLGLEAPYGETLQAQRYEPGQEYKLHCDYFPAFAHYWPAMRVSGGQRCWTTMAYLCDVEQGGETHFPRLDIMIPPRRGTLLIWNNMRADGGPNGETVHAALPVISGNKYVLTRWYRERAWTP